MAKTGKRQYAYYMHPRGELRHIPSFRCAQCRFYAQDGAPPTCAVCLRENVTTRPVAAHNHKER